MAISVVSRSAPEVRLSSAASATGSADRVVNNPGCKDGELLIAIQSQSGGTDAAMTAPSDLGFEWTQRGSTGGSSSVGYMKVWVRTASNEPDQWTFGGDGNGVVTVLVIRNWDHRGGSHLWHVEPTFNTGSNASTHNAPAVDIADNYPHRLINAWAAEEDGGTYTYPALTLWTEHEQTATSTHVQAVASVATGGAGNTLNLPAAYSGTGGSDYVALTLIVSSPPGHATSVAQPSVSAPYWSTSGNTLVAVVAANSEGQSGATDCQISSIIDDAHNTWVQASDATDFVTGYPGEPNTAVRLGIWYCTGAAAVTNVTATMTQTVDSLAITILEASGVTNVNPVDLADADQDNDDIDVQASRSTSNANDLVIAAGATGSSDRTFTVTASGGFTSLPNADVDSGVAEDDVLLRSAYRVTTSAGSQSITWTLSPAGNGVWAMLALKEGTVDTSNANPNWPQVTHELGFGTDPNDPTTAYTWTDVTDRVLSFSARRGRDYELTRTEAGESDVRLRNDDGAFDPSNTSSPYYPDVRVFTPYRIRAEWSGRVYSVFQGYVERWPQLWDDEYGTSPMEAVDGLATLSATRLVGTLGAEIEADGPVAYWPLDDGKLANTAANKAESNTVPLKITSSSQGGGSSFFGADLDLQGEESTCWEATIHGNVALTSPLSEHGSCLATQLETPLDIGDGILAECWAKFPGFSTSLDYGLLSLNSSSFTSETYHRIAEITVNSSTGACTLGVSNSSGTFTGYSSGESGLNDNEWHHYVMHLTSNRARLWIDGSLRVDQTLSSTPTNDADWVFVGGQAAEWGDLHFMSGRVAHVALFALGTADERRISARANAGLFGFPEKSGARVSRLLNYANWTAGRAIDEGQTLLGSTASIANQTLLAAVQDVASWENGLAFVDASGNFRFVDRLTHFNETTKWVFGEDEANGEIPYETDVEIQYDPKYVYNDVKVTRQAGRTSGGGASVRRRDQDSIRAYFTRNLDKTSGAASIQQCILEAQWIIDEYAQPRLRLARITITPSANPALWPIALSAEIGDRVLVKRRPFGGSEITLDCYIEQVHHQVMPNKWTVTYSLSPKLNTTYEGDNGWVLGASILGIDTYLGP